MTSKGKIALILVCVVILFVATVIGFYVYWLGKNREPLLQAQRSGLAYGKTTDDFGCWRKAIEQQVHSKDFAASLQNNSYTLACLAAAANSPNFCAGVPRPGQMIETARWNLNRCKEPDIQGLSQTHCQSLLRTLQTYCSEYYKQ